MFWWFKKKNDPKKDRPVIICIHGFGKRKTDEYIPLYEAMKDDYDIVMPELFDQRYPEDNIWHNWVSRAEEKVLEAKKQNREVILIGFSMGGVIATYIASKFNIKKLILLAPAFEYLHLKTAKSAVVSNKKKEEDGKYLKLPSEFTNTFIDVVDNCKDAIKDIHCPTLFIAATGDEVIPYTISSKYYKKVPHEAKKCIILEDGQHRLLDDERLSKLVINLIRNFIENKF